MWAKAAIAKLDRYFPPCGPCAFCGGKDARHRVWDTLMDRPEPATVVAADMEYPVEAVRMVRRIRPYRRGGTVR